MLSQCFIGDQRLFLIVYVHVYQVTTFPNQLTPLPMKVGSQCSSKSYQKASIVNGHHVFKVTHVSGHLKSAKNSQWVRQQTRRIRCSCVEILHCLYVAAPFDVFSVTSIAWSLVFTVYALCCHSRTCDYCHMDIVPHPRHLLETLCLFA